MFFRLVCTGIAQNILNISNSPRVLIHSRMASKKALVVLSEGCEEMEFVISVDVLRRAGVDVTVGGMQGSGCHTASRKVKICADSALEEAVNNGPYDAIILPGGMGAAKEYCKNSVVGDLLKKQESAGGLIAAICAAPMALRAHNIGVGKKITSYPDASVTDEVMKDNLYTYSDSRVVIDGKLITSRGPGTAFEFAVAIVGHLLGEQAAVDVAKPMLLS